MNHGFKAGRIQINSLPDREECTEAARVLREEFKLEPCRVIRMTVPKLVDTPFWEWPEESRDTAISIVMDEREQREELARLHTLEEARVAREMRESQAFNDAMRRFEELQRRTIWQRIKALFGGKP